MSSNDELDEKPMLIPPSVFEELTKATPPTGRKSNNNNAAKHGGESWKTIQSMTDELVALKLENQKLKDQTLKLSMPAANEEFKARINVHHENAANPPAAVDVRSPWEYHHLNEIISRQATEIAELRLNLDQVNREYHRNTEQMESEVVEMQRKVQILEHEAELSKQKWSLEIESVQNAVASEKTGLASTISRLELELENKEKMFKNAETKQQFEMKRLEEETSRTVQKLMADIESKNIESKDLQCQLDQLKTYLGNYIDQNSVCDSWTKDKQKLESTIKELESTKQCLEKANELLKIRLSALTNILTIQENELSKSQLDHADKSGGMCLLTRWREKVFELMVQLKSFDISSKHDSNNINRKLSVLESSLSAAKNENNRLQHCLQDKQAEVDIEKNNVKCIEIELTRAQQIALTLDDQIKEDKTNIKQLHQFIEHIVEDFHSVNEKLCESEEKLISYDKRLRFAVKRVAMLRGQMLRRDALERLKAKDETQSHKDAEHSRNSSSQFCVDTATELERVTEERDRLTDQITSDSRLLQSKIQEAHDTYANKLTELESDTSRLQIQLDAKIQECERLNSLVVEKVGEIAATQQLVETLRKESQLQQQNFDKVIEDVEKNKETEMTEKLSEMEKNLNELRREHAKAVVSMRQMERQLTREKERATEHERAVELRHQRELNKTNTQLKSLEKERNLLMATLRQEGLLSKARRAPAVGTTSATTVAETTKDDQPQEEQRIDLNTSKDEDEGKPSVHDLLEDLKTLTEDDP
ncbi:coiled-coil alpha-helical rod protein 1-like [Tubulanus polymorphus]|uniref:coiled-coil alpha-helical rod protein 1-like n=1 Tax=Tubulanus polymorphus TaxID=672921 RepID=UPI003DA65392